MLSQIADVADLIAAASIIVSLLFVAYEVRLNRKQAELTNWRESLVMMVEFKSRTNDPDFADLIIRGHRDFDALSEAEKLSFGMYLEEGVHSLGNFLKHNDSLPKKLVGIELALTNTFADLFLTPGGAAWWADAHQQGRFMPETYRVIDRMLATREANDGKPVLSEKDL